MRRTTFAVLLLLFLCLAPSAFADTFSWSYTGEGVNASGMFETTPLNDGTFQITNISGQRNGVPITGLSTFGFADNLIYPNLPIFDYAGFSFVAGGTEFNIYGTMEHTPDGANAVLTEGFVTFDPERTAIFTELTEFTLTRVEEVPEPASLVLMSTGLVVLARRVRRTRRGERETSTCPQ